MALSASLPRCHARRGAARHGMKGLRVRASFAKEDLGQVVRYAERAPTGRHTQLKAATAGTLPVGGSGCYRHRFRLGLHPQDRGLGGAAKVGTSVRDDAPNGCWALRWESAVLLRRSCRAAAARCPTSDCRDILWVGCAVRYDTFEGLSNLPIRGKLSATAFGVAKS